MPEKILVRASQDQTILEALLRAGIEINHTCGGMGTCGTCQIQVVSGLQKLGARSEVETELAQDRNFATDERLSCQTIVQDGLIVRKPS